MMGFKRPKVFVTAVFLCIVVFAAHRYEFLPDTAAWSAQLSSSGPTIWRNAKPQLRENAHKLRSADDFMPHFAAVVAMEGVTLKEAKRSCSWGPDEKVNFQYPASEDWVVNERRDDEVRARRRQWREFVSHGMIPWAQVKDKFSGRGVVIVAGNQDTLMRVKVILRALVRLNSRIPVEINYFAGEVGDASRRELAAIYPHMFFNDLSLGHNIIRIEKDAYKMNFQLKTAAVINSRFAEPLLLDSDNIPVIYPEALYDSDTYREYGTVFWPDIARTRPENPAWAITNTYCRMDEYEQESGQLLVDKARYFYHLQLASLLNNEQGAYYNAFLLGDKDMFRFAWHALRTAYGRPKKWLASVGTLNEDYYCGHSFAQHHPNDGRVAFLHGGLLKTAAPEVVRWNRETRRGIYRSYKRAPSDEDPEQSVNVGIKLDQADYMHNHSAEFKPAMCTDMFDVEPRDLYEIAPGFEHTFEAIGGYWQLDDPKRA